MFNGLFNVVYSTRCLVGVNMLVLGVLIYKLVCTVPGSSPSTTHGRARTIAIALRTRSLRVTPAVIDGCG